MDPWCKLEVPLLVKEVPVFLLVYGPMGYPGGFCDGKGVLWNPLVKPGGVLFEKVVPISLDGGVSIVKKVSDFHDGLIEYPEGSPAVKDFPGTCDEPMGCLVAVDECSPIFTGLGPTAGDARLRALFPPLAYSDETGVLDSTWIPPGA